jgi:hypothetical protein
MFQRDQMLSFYQQVDELEAKRDAGDFGRLEQGYEEHELVSMAADVLQEIADGLSNQTGFTHAQLIVSSHALLTLEKKIHGRWAGWPIPDACHTAENEKTRKRAG